MAIPHRAWTLQIAVVCLLSGGRPAASQEPPLPPPAKAQQLVMLNLLRELSAEVKALRREVGDLRRRLEGVQLPESAPVRPDEPQLRGRPSLNSVRAELLSRQNQVARETAELDLLKSQLSKLTIKQRAEVKDIAKLEDVFPDEQERYKIGSRTYSLREVEADLARRRERMQASSERLVHLGKLLTIRQQSLLLGQEQLEAVSRRYRALQVEVEAQELERRQTEVQTEKQPGRTSKPADN